MSIIKFSKCKKFKLITGKNLLELGQSLAKEQNADKLLENTELSTLGLYLVDTEPNPVEGKKEFERLMKNDEERFTITDTLDAEELLADVLG